MRDCARNQKEKYTGENKVIQNVFVRNLKQVDLKR
jgi:hypothetical protein